MTTEKLLKDWYNRKYSAKGKSSGRPYEAYPIFLDYLEVKKGKRLLDVGCGTGYLLKEADRRGLETYGVDISDEGVRIAKKVSPNSKILTGSGEGLGFPDNFFDYVTCLGALEHFLDLEKGFGEIVRVAKKGALLCVVVPNVNYLFWMGKERRGTDQQDISENLLALNQWKNLFLRGDCKVEKIYQDRWLVNKINILESINPIIILKRAVYKLIWTFLPLNLTYQFVFILRKNDERGLS
ncbi:MAG: methyltransferase domain-containing protein [Parcubacteria group bacterium]